MTPEEAILTVLEPIEGLRGKVYPAEAIKNAAAPFVFYLQHGEDEDETLDGPTGLMTAVYEINCVARNYAGLSWLVGVVRRACSPCRVSPMLACSSSGPASGRLPRT